MVLIKTKYNLGNEVPYHPFKDCLRRILYPRGLSDLWRGALRPIYEMAHHFFTLSNSSTPYVKQILERRGYRTESIDQFYDRPDLGSFTYN
jgi:hypothetical protein